MNKVKPICPIHRCYREYCPSDLIEDYPHNDYSEGLEKEDKK